MDWTVLWWVVVAALVVVGLAGTVVPALPGVPLVFAGLLLGAWLDGFETVGWGTLALLALLTVISVVIDFLAAALGARRRGASQRAFWGATAGAVVGMFFGLPGIVLGPFIGAVMGELSAGRTWQQAGASGYGVWIGIVLGTAANLAIVFLMLGVFAMNVLLAG